MTNLIALIIWALSYLTFGYLPDNVRPLFPDSCVAYEDGSVTCPGLHLPGYDNLERR